MIVWQHSQRTLGSCTDCVRMLPLVVDTFSRSIDDKRSRRSQGEEKMPVTIDSRGIVVTPGPGLNVRGATTQTQAPSAEVSAITAHVTGTVGGVFTISGTAVIGVTLPDPSVVPGVDFIYRVASAHAHYLSSSQVTQDSFTLCSTTANGSKLALPAVVGSSVSLKSDGVNYLIQGASGSFTLSRASA